MSMRRILMSAILVLFTRQPQVANGQTVESLARKSGCFECHGVGKKVIGPAFHAIAAKYKNDLRGYALRFMSVAEAEDLPKLKTSTVIIAQVGTGLQVRVFDDHGKRIVDKAEPNLLSERFWPN